MNHCSVSLSSAMRPLPFKELQARHLLPAAVRVRCSSSNRLPGGLPLPLAPWACRKGASAPADAFEELRTSSRASTLPDGGMWQERRHGCRRAEF